MSDEVGARLRTFIDCVTGYDSVVGVSLATPEVAPVVTIRVIGGCPLKQVHLIHLEAIRALPNASVVFV